MHSDVLDLAAVLNTLKKTHVQTLWTIAELGGRARLKDLQKKIKASKSTLSSRLAALADKGLVTYEAGFAELVYKTPLCYLANIENIPYAYVGLLGKPLPVEHREPETETAISLLREEGITIDKILVATTKDAIEEWTPIMSPELRAMLDFAILDIREMNSIEAVMDRMTRRILDLTRRYITILDCTSGTRPAGIAYYAIADKLKTPLIYVYADEKRIYWLKNRRTLITELNLQHIKS